MVNIPAYSQILSIKPSVLLNCYINHCNWLIYLCKLIDTFYIMYTCTCMYACIEFQTAMTISLKLLHMYIFSTMLQLSLFYLEYTNP